MSTDPLSVKDSNTMNLHYCNIVCLGKNRCYFEDVIDYIIKIFGASESVDIIENKTNLLFGVHEVCSFFYPLFPDNVIVFNTEQLFYSSEWLNINYINILKNHVVLDYCKSNQQWLLQELDIKSEVFEFGEFKIYNNDNTDIDILFYGTYTEERWKVFNSIKHLPLKIEFKDMLWGNEKINLINRSKIVLNLHRYDSKKLQIIKLFPLISSNKIIISERCSDEDDYKHLKNIIFCDIENISETILSCIHKIRT